MNAIATLSLQAKILNWQLLIQMGRVRRRGSVKWRTEKMCDNCPFAKQGKGRFLRMTLGKNRWREILDSLRSNQNFPCHKTTEETGNGTNLICAGSLEWQEKHHVSGNFARIMERLSHFKSTQVAD